MSVETTCPICSIELKIHDDSISAYGHHSQQALDLGKEVVSLECGHRIHRGCLTEWLKMSSSGPTCPMCRATTEWLPKDSQNQEIPISTFLSKSWKSISNQEQTAIKWIWIFAGIFSFTDPIGYFVLGGFLMLLTPPMLYAEMAIFISSLRHYIVGEESSGVRILLAIGIAFLLTCLLLINHEINKFPEATVGTINRFLESETDDVRRYSNF